MVRVRVRIGVCAECERVCVPGRVDERAHGSVGRWVGDQETVYRCERDVGACVCTQIVPSTPSTRTVFQQERH
jgi:hypothetical protein